MTTLNTLRERLEAQYLEPVNEETPTTTIESDISDSALSVQLTRGVLSPSEESYLAAGRPLELDNELIRIESYSTDTGQLTIRRRGYRNTEPAAHTAADCEVRIPTRWPRQTMLDTLRASIDGLWQPLYAVATEQATIDTADYIPLPANTVRILKVEIEDQDGDFQPIDSRFLPQHPLDPTVAAVLPKTNPYPNSLCLIEYGYKIETPDGADTEIEGLPRQWERIVLADAAAELLAGVDIDQQTQERLTQQIQAEGFPVRSGSTITQSLIGFVEYLVTKADKEQISKYPRKVRRVRTSLFGSGG